MVFLQPSGTGSHTDVSSWWFVKGSHSRDLIRETIICWAKNMHIKLQLHDLCLYNAVSMGKGKRRPHPLVGLYEGFAL